MFSFINCDLFCTLNVPSIHLQSPWVVFQIVIYANKCALPFSGGNFLLISLCFDQKKIISTVCISVGLPCLANSVEDKLRHTPGTDAWIPKTNECVAKNSLFTHRGYEITPLRWAPNRERHLQDSSTWRQQRGSSRRWLTAAASLMYSSHINLLLHKVH